jgi:hypothetical protein
VTIIQQWPLSAYTGYGPSGTIYVDPDSVLARTATEALTGHRTVRTADDEPICQLCGELAPCPTARNAVDVCRAAGTTAQEIRRIGVADVIPAARAKPPISADTPRATVTVARGRMIGRVDMTSTPGRSTARGPDEIPPPRRSSALTEPTCALPTIIPAIGIPPADEPVPVPSPDPDPVPTPIPPVDEPQPAAATADAAVDQGTDDAATELDAEGAAGTDPVIAGYPDDEYPDGEYPEGEYPDGDPVAPDPIAIAIEASQAEAAAVIADMFQLDEPLDADASGAVEPIAAGADRTDESGPVLPDDVPDEDDDEDDAVPPEVGAVLAEAAPAGDQPHGDYQQREAHADALDELLERELRESAEAA